jgi:hypothetical protein
MSKNPQGAFRLFQPVQVKCISCTLINARDLTQLFEEGSVANYIDRAADLLFPETGRRALNVKFFDACEHNVTAEELAEQIVRAEAQIASGSAELVTNID